MQHIKAKAANARRAGRAGVNLKYRAMRFVIEGRSEDKVEEQFIPANGVETKALLRGGQEGVMGGLANNPQNW